MQHKFCSPSHFLQRTDALALRAGCLLKELPAKLGISERAMFGYRSGKYPVTAKALRKLEAAERAVGLALIAGSSVNPNEPGVRETTHDPYAVRDEETPYRCEVDPVAAAFAKIREGLDLLEQLMKNHLQP
jgi:hypothetical protein